MIILCIPTIDVVPLASDATLLLRAARAGDGRASDSLFQEVYDELRRLAQSRIAAEPGIVTISATGLVHDAYLKLVDGDDWADRAHFMAVAARAMRQILTDRARARNADKRGGAVRAVTLDADVVGAAETTAAQVLAVDHALDRLARRDARLAQLVELRFFGGLEVAEAAEALGVSVSTAARDWARAKAHLHLLLR
jgi:RNA polymerase sigma factor (TIGR02999 family)